MLNPEEKRYLLHTARQAICARLGENLKFKEPLKSENIEKSCGVFVTLNKHEELRGCIGYVEGIRPLDQAVKEMAVAAAFEDPRFDPVTKSELADLKIEISVLSSLQRINSIDEVRVGTHGIVVENALQRGLLLPQVAIENGWSPQEFIEYTCIKAGMETDAWKDQRTKILIFTAEIFSE